MIQLKLTAGSKYIKRTEEQAIRELQRLLSRENGYILPATFIGKQTMDREIDAILLLPDAIFLLDFKNWRGQRIEVEGSNSKVRRFVDGVWKEEHNALPNYRYAAKELGGRLKKERRWLPVAPPIYAALVFTSIDLDTRPQISFAGGDPQRPQPEGAAGACRIEQLPQLIAAFRAATPTNKVHLNAMQQAKVAEVLLSEVKAAAKPRQHSIEGYLLLGEHHTDSFLDCKIYLGEGEVFKDPVWIKEYGQVLASQDQRAKREQLVLRHADVLTRFAQHKHIVEYRTFKSTDDSLYVILARRSGAFLSELLTGEPHRQTPEEELKRIPFDLAARFHILGGLLNALQYLTQQPGFKKSAYRDLRPDSIFVQYSESELIAQLFNFDCTKIPGRETRLNHLKKGKERDKMWDEYASPELLEYVDKGQSTPGAPASFKGDVRSDIYSWGIIAWELLTGELPFKKSDDKLVERRKPWPDQLAPELQLAGSILEPEAIRLIEACLVIDPARRPDLATLRRCFP
ncbi:NERD domain-containing protein kinase family protein [Ktedonobacter racemifer]|uniref:non-specific serine/threonine protein kinase n=1 Tax=Ktedonobacter racemifer DSM 44963 TaxID=485913 RepID=D6U688_KTERA|nr:NERD domain-containing protein kinase family protein [Ktedonobacter racemifer]EFH80499.1 serine/threonine protein kinase [Ktedonobacter racemifer DSM 44963]